VLTAIGSLTVTATDAVSAVAPLDGETEVTVGGAAAGLRSATTCPHIVNDVALG
jgi:hypothetical protein